MYAVLHIVSSIVSTVGCFITPILLPPVCPKPASSALCQSKLCRFKIQLIVLWQIKDYHEKWHLP